MAEVTSLGPFRRLQRLDRLGQEHRNELPQRYEARVSWSGVAFRLGGQHYLAAMQEVTEILTYPPAWRVPHAKPWVRGIANVRGSLMAVMDFNGFLDRGLSSLTRQSRVLVIDLDGVYSGLVVDEVLGMRHFDAEEWQERISLADTAAEHLVTGGFVRDGEHWPVLSLSALVRNPQFLKVAE